MTPGTPPPIRAVIFDMDGCLVDTEPLSLEAVAAEMRASGLPDVTAAQVGERYLGVSLTQILRDVEARIGRACAPGFTDRIEERLFASYSAGVPRISGADGLLTALDKAGIAVAVASGASVRRLAVTLDRAGLAGRFRGREFSADQVRHGKPAPDVFLLAARSLGVPARNCAVLEDSPHGIKGAVAAGMRAVGFVGGSHLAGRRAEQAAILRHSGARLVIDSLSQAFDALIVQELQRGIR